MKTQLLTLLFITTLLSCDDNRNMTVDSKITLTRSLTEYGSAISANGTGDPFILREVLIKGDSAIITVSYSGGCKQHTFEIIWGETYQKSYPPQTDFLLIHNGHDDSCEALITETISFRISELTGPVDYEKVVINIVNAGNPSQRTSAGEWFPSDSNIYNVVIPQGDECQIEITASEVICGAGLWDNLWFALNDSVSSGVEGTYFKKWLQPVALSDDLKGFKPVRGKKYLIGARIQQNHPFTNVVVCLAYSGPSVPVKITCIKELE